MITLEELKKDKEALEEKFRKYEKQEQQKELVKDSYELEYPKEGEKVYYIYGSGLVEEDEFDKNGYFMFSQGHIKFTEEEAELESKRRDLMTRFNQFRDKCNGDWKPSFRSVENKYFIQLLEDLTGNILEVKHVVFADLYSKFGYFKNQQDCEKAIELFGDEIKELF